MGWRDVAAERYPEESFPDASEFYVRVAIDAAFISIKQVKVETWQAPGEEPNMAASLLRVMPEAMKLSAYSESQQAMYKDGATNTQDELNRLLRIIDSSIQQRQEQRQQVAG